MYTFVCCVINELLAFKNQITWYTFCRPADSQLKCSSLEFAVQIIRCVRAFFQCNYAQIYIKTMCVCERESACIILSNRIQSNAVCNAMEFICIAALHIINNSNHQTIGEIPVVCLHVQCSIHLFTRLSQPHSSFI